MSSETTQTHYKEIAGLFLKLGVIAFGGPAAHIAMLEEEVVQKRQWMSEQHFLDMVGATSLIPGPNSTEMAIHCGYHRAGLPGLLIAGLCFLFPATVLTGILAWVYVTYQSVPQLHHWLMGIKPAVIALIAAALYRLGKKALKSWQLGLVGAGVVVASMLGVGEILALLTGGAIGMIWLRILASDASDSTPEADATVDAAPDDSDEAVEMKHSAGALGWLALPSLLPFGAATAAAAPGLGQLFLVFLKVGAILFGSGYVLVAFLDGELVKSLGWLTQSQLLDAIAIGQLTPGPVLSTATFVGFQIKGVWGAVLATIGIFLPSFVFVALLNPMIPHLRSSRWASAFLDAVNICAVGLMLAVTIKLCISTLTGYKPVLIFGASMAYVVANKGKGNALWLVVGGGLAGYLLSFV